MCTNNEFPLKQFHTLKTLKFHLELKFDVYGTQSCNKNYHWLLTPHIGLTMLKCQTEIPWSWSYGDVNHKGNGCGEEKAHNTIP
jgi:hypothetical protein